MKILLFTLPAFSQKIRFWIILITKRNADCAVNFFFIYIIGTMAKFRGFINNL